MFKTTTFTAALFAASAAAVAGPVSFDFEGIGRGRSAQIQVDGGAAQNVFIGSVMHRVDGELLSTYCVDPEQWAQTGVRNFERTQLWKTFQNRDYAREKANTIAELADNIGDTLWQSDVNRDTAAAFQLAVWEIIKDYNPFDGAASFDFASGAFKATGNANIFSLASNMLSGLDFNRGNDLGYVGYYNDTYQDFMGKAVPAPGTFALAMAGLPLLASRRRKG